MYGINEVFDKAVLDNFRQKEYEFQIEKLEVALNILHQ